MDIRRKIIIHSIVLTGLCFIQATTACPPPLIPETVIVKCGTLTASETWESGKTYYITGDVIVPAGITLTIEPGCIVKFDYSKSLIANGEGGTIIAEGTPTNYITFTSKCDNSVGEEIVPGGTAQAEQWKEFLINRNCSVSFCKISCAISGLKLMDSINTEGASLTIRDNIIRMCRYGINLWYVAADDFTVDIFNNLITDNTNGNGIFCQFGGYYHSILDIHNNTIDNCYDAIRTSNTDVSTIYNNLISNCNRGIKNDLPSFEPVCYYNAFFETDPKFEDVSAANQGTASNVEPTVSPFTDCILGNYYLNEDSAGGVLLIDAGYDPEDQGMPWYTVLCDIFYGSDDDAPVDIGYHYPMLYNDSGWLLGEGGKWPPLPPPPEICPEIIEVTHDDYDTIIDPINYGWQNIRYETCEDSYFEVSAMFKVEDSGNCGLETNPGSQYGTLYITFDLPITQTITLAVEGKTERHQSSYDYGIIYVDSTMPVIISGTGEGLECEMMVHKASVCPYNQKCVDAGHIPKKTVTLTPGPHTIEFYAATGDALYHEDAYLKFSAKMPGYGCEEAYPPTVIEGSGVMEIPQPGCYIIDSPYGRYWPLNLPTEFRMPGITVTYKAVLYNCAIVPCYCSSMGQPVWLLEIIYVGPVILP